LGISALAAAGLTLFGAKPVLAEFEVQESGIEKGEVEIEYRGAYHWGLPREGQTGGAGILDDEVEGEVGEEGGAMRKKCHSARAMMSNSRWVSPNDG
jgi:hypothetical protein